MNFGIFEGLCYEEIIKKYPETREKIQKAILEAYEAPETEGTNE